jgi:hypothetical protein
LKQYNGTCWFNATLNTIILTPEFKNLLIKRWNDEVDKNKIINMFPNYQSFQNNDNADFVEMFLGLIYNLLIVLNKPKEDDGNIVGPLAARLKGIAEEHNWKYFKEHKVAGSFNYENGYHSGKAIKPLIDVLFPCQKEIDFIDLPVLNSNKFNYGKTLPNFFIMMNTGKKKLHGTETLQDNISVNNEEYSLRAASIGFTATSLGITLPIGHVICGFTPLKI